MKTTLLLIFTLFIAIELSAQSHRFADTTAQWNVVHYEPGWFPQTPPSHVAYIHNVDGDTIINNRAYQRITSAMFRRDLNGDVYTRIDTHEYKAYAFAPGIGDTIFNIRRQFDITDSFKCTVTNTDSVLWGHNRKRLYVSCENYTGVKGFADEWVDGIGSILHDPIYLEVSGLLVQTGTTALQCYFEDGVRYYHNATYVDTCSWLGYTGINEIERISASIYPNPANGNFAITLSEQPKPNTSLIVYDTPGRIVKQEELIFSTQQISVVDLPNGIYTYAVIQNNMRQTSAKLVIAK